MRQAILVVMLVGAAFLGGAFVNGPGLQWAQTRVLRSLGLNNGGEIAALDLTSNATSETSSDTSSPSKPYASRLGSHRTDALTSQRKTSLPNKMRLIAPRRRELGPQSSGGVLGAEQSRPASLPSASVDPIGDEIFRNVGQPPWIPNSRRQVPTVLPDPSRSGRTSGNPFCPSSIGLTGRPVTPR